MTEVQPRKRFMTGPLAEPVEPRLLFTHGAAADFTSLNSKGIVRLIGTDGDDRFVLRNQGGQYVIEHDGRTVNYAFGKVNGFVFEGGLGNDFADLTISGNKSSLYGGEGNDTLLGGTYRDTLIGNVGADLLRGGGHEDSIDGGSGADRIFGDGGNDSLYGGKGNDRIYGGPDVDYINAGKGDDAITAGGGDDAVFGGAGHDVGLDLSMLAHSPDGVEVLLP